MKPDTRLSPHFRYEEFFSRKKRGGPFIVPPPLHLHHKLGQLVAALEVIRHELGDHPIIVYSGYRSPEFNKKVKGSPRSQHMQAAAADIAVRDVLYYQVAETIEELIAKRRIPEGGLGIYDIDHMVHYDVRWTRSRWRQDSRKKMLSGDDFYHGPELIHG